MEDDAIVQDALQVIFGLGGESAHKRLEFELPPNRPDSPSTGTPGENVLPRFCSAKENNNDETKATDPVSVKCCPPQEVSATTTISCRPPIELPPSSKLSISLHNVVSTFSCRCHLNLRRIATEATNVEYRPEMGRVIMRLKQPRTTAHLVSSGKITCTGAVSEDGARRGARKVAVLLKRLGFKIRFINYRVVNVLASVAMPFGVKLAPFTTANRTIARYEPELHPGVTVTLKQPDCRATLKVFSTGSVTVTSRRVSHIGVAVERVYPLLALHRRDKQLESNLDS